jgi:hypothetical protein
MINFDRRRVPDLQPVLEVRRPAITVAKSPNSSEYRSIRALRSNWESGSPSSFVWLIQRHVEELEEREPVDVVAALVEQSKTTPAADLPLSPEQAQELMNWLQPLIDKPPKKPKAGTGKEIIIKNTAKSIPGKEIIMKVPRNTAKKAK